ncbi:MAG: hypothetical protein LBK99_26340 [Opitutaceae bacterium]|jgi:hypothetical protein|nr:hypothetical protein [Opitutaceae bacterium]
MVAGVLLWLVDMSQMAFLPDHSDYSPWRATKFYVPLVVQAASQSLTYPLVASIVSHGALGKDALAAFAQGQGIMFVIGSLGGGLLTTGMLFGRDAEGFRIFKRLNRLFAVALLVAQGGVCLPGVDSLVFRGILGLPDPLDHIARNVTFLCIPVQLLFFLRNAPLVALYNARASAPANWATLARIALTVFFAWLFPLFGWTGYGLGVLAMTVPVGLELFLSQYFARPYVPGIRGGTAAAPAIATAEAPANASGAAAVSSLRTQFLFTIPLSFGGVLLALSGIIIGAFIARADAPTQMLPVHYMVLGVVNPVGFAALRMQAVVLAFAPRDRYANNILRFGIVAGLALAIFPLLGQVPAVARWYFVGVQNLPEVDVPLAARAMLAVGVLPVLQAMRGHAEGLAAWRKRPNAILAGQAVYLASIVTVLSLCLHFGTPGYLMGIMALLVAISMTLVTVRFGLLWADLEDSFERVPRPRGTEGPNAAP